MENEQKPGGRVSLFYWVIPLMLFITLIMTVCYTSGFQNYTFLIKSWVTTLTTPSGSEDEIDKMIFQVQNNIKSLENNFAKLVPEKPYIIINTTANRFSLRQSNGDTIRNGLCSTGKDEILIGKDKKPFVFRTPRGLFKILNKRTAPIWVKPDWAFIEEGLPIPSARSPKRIDQYTLGDYSLGLGDGYMIHGTLYQRRLGYGETHGCVRVGDADLEVIYNTLSKGSKVYIY